MTAFDTLCRIVSTFFGAGYVPKAPGTAGTFAALPLYLLLRKLSLPRYLLVILAIAAAGTAASSRMERLWGKDPQRVVIDEVAGVLVALIARPRRAGGVVLGALIFRIFDILKPWPLKRLEKLPGGLGIMADDVAAGAVSSLVLAGVLRLFGRAR